MVPIAAADTIGLDPAEGIEHETLRLKALQHGIALRHYPAASRCASAMSRTTLRTIFPRSLRGISASLKICDGTASARMRSRHQSLISSSVPTAPDFKTIATAT